MYGSSIVLICGIMDNNINLNLYVVLTTYYIVLISDRVEVGRD